MNVTAAGIAVALAVIVGVGLFVFGPQMFSAPVETASDIRPDLSTASVAASLPTQQPIQKPMSQDLPQELPTTLTVTDTQVGTGSEAVAGATVAVKYTGMLPNGTVFDATERHGGEPIEFALGTGRVIRGWDEGLLGMKVGGKRRLVIPPDMAYGSQGVGSIPPNSTLIFDVELVAVNGGQ